MTYKEAVQQLSHIFQFVKLPSSTPLFYLRQLDTRAVIGGPFFLKAVGNDYEMIAGEEAFTLYDTYRQQIEGNEQ